jgi:hypothetical protein
VETHRVEDIRRFRPRLKFARNLLSILRDDDCLFIKIEGFSNLLPTRKELIKKIAARNNSI